MEKEIIKIDNGYILKINNKTLFFEDFAQCIVNAFSDEFEKMHTLNACLIIKTDIE